MHDLTAIFATIVVCGVLTGCATGTPSLPVVESIVFVSERSGAGDIYALDPESLSVTPLITTAATESIPAWDRARNRLVYQSSDADADGVDLASNQRRIMRDPSVAGAPSWSPDGKTLVFAANRDGNENLFIARVDGNGERRITDGRFTDRHPAFSPDGQSIIFARRDDIGWDLHSYDLRTANTTRHTLDGVYLAHPTWSPDGTRIAFDRQWDTQTDIAVVLLETGDLTRLTEGIGNAVSPSFSLDGARLVFAADVEGDTDLWEVAVDGTGLRQLTSSKGFDGDAIFVPDDVWLRLVSPALQPASE